MGKGDSRDGNEEPKPNLRADSPREGSEGRGDRSPGKQKLSLDFERGGSGSPSKVCFEAAACTLCGADGRRSATPCALLTDAHLQRVVSGVAESDAVLRSRIVISVQGSAERH